MTAWLNEKHHACKIELLEFELKQVQVEIELESRPLPWVEFQEKTALLHELRDNIARCKLQNQYFLAEDNKHPNYDI